MGLISELRRRSVLRMAVLYVLAAWVVMQVAGVLMDLGALPVAIGPWVLVVLGIGFPIALVFSWLFEITPEGLAREKDVPEGASITHVTGRRVDFIVIAILSAGLILFAYDKWSVPAPAEASIAVLPFKNLSADPEQEYFADGIAEEILDVLARTPGLTVIASRSSFQFRGENLDIKEVGRALGVALILEGSVRNENSTVRVVAQLIDAAAGTHLWSQSYDREFEDVLALQNDLSKAVVSAVSEHVGLTSIRDPRLPSAENPEAYAAYMRGRHARGLQTEAGLHRAIEQFEKAVELEPGFALAHAALAEAHMKKISVHVARDSDEANLAAGVRHTKLALALEPDLANAHYAMAIVLGIDGRFDEAIQHLEQVIRSNPNHSGAHFLLGSYLGSFYQGNYAQGRTLWKKAQALTPTSVSSYTNEVNLLRNRRKLDKALEQIDKLESISPAAAAYKRGYLAAIDGEWANTAIGTLNALQIDSSEGGGWRVLAREMALLGLEAEVRAISQPPSIRALHTLGRTREAATIAKEIVARDRQIAGAPLYSKKVNARILGRALAAAGDFENARPLLEEMWELSGHRVTGEGPFRRAEAAALIAIRGRADEKDTTDELITALQDDVRRMRDDGIVADSADYQEGLAAFLGGQRQLGLELIAQAVERGFYILPNEAYLQELYEDPDFQPILRAQEERQTRERERFLAIVCGENPWADVWQPREETCKQFFAAAGQ
jgi:TolB-like protein/Flp pilus assembly protein TadD